MRLLEWELACAAVREYVPLPEVHTVEEGSVICRSSSGSAAVNPSIFFFLFYDAYYDCGWYPEAHILEGNFCEKLQWQ